MTTPVDITQLQAGTVKGTDVYPAVDVTDTAQAPSGTTKKYTVTQLASYIASSVGGITFSTVSGTSQTLVTNHGYITSNVALTTFTLPTTAAIGDLFQIIGIGSGGYRIAQNVGQSIHIGSSTTTPGNLGYLQSTNRYDQITIRCSVANTEFSVVSVIGNITVV